MKQAFWLGLALSVLGGWPTAALAHEPSEGAEQSQSAAQEEFFESRIRPLLSERCLACHGPDKQQSGLRLDSRAGLLAGGDSGPVVDLANPRSSRLLTAVGYEDPDLQMPPAPAGKLPSVAIAALTTWVEQGVFWPKSDLPGKPAALASEKTHWAFTAIRSQPIPPVQDRAWPRSPIDYFVLNQLEGQGTSPAPDADRTALIRRVTFDLIGLPPSDAEVAAFVDDPRPDAYARLIDRLLDSPHYGERWGRYWLDVARYADTKGYVRLQEERRFYCAFTYRDYVIDSFNQDLPYDRFIVEQLAADQLPPDTDPRALAALGFLTLGRQFTGNKHDVIDDRIDVVTRGLLGLTVTCARCHDHKYDPIPTADYYSLYGVFASSEDVIFPTPLGNATAGATATQHESELAARQRALDDYEPKQHVALLNEFRSRGADYLVKAIAGREPPQQPLPKAAGEIRQIVVERWIEYLERTGPNHPVLGPWHAFATLQPEDFASAAATIVAGWSTSGGNQQTPRVHTAVKSYFTSHPPRSMMDVARGYGDLLAQVHQRWQTLLASTATAGSGALGRLSDPDEEELRQVLYTDDSPVAVRPLEAVAEYLYDAPINEEIVRRRNAIHQYLSHAAGGPPRAHTLIELPAPCEPRVFVRGNPTRPGRQVPRQFLKALSPVERKPFVQGGGRLELARAIVSRDNPLTARVAVNRVWAHHFGTGLVRSPSNFGLRGEAPTHPELLDYLAARFIDEGWSIKQLHRWILLSHTYQQGTGDNGLRSRDPENRLFGRMNRQRLDFEALRDALLVAAGRLDRTMGGPSVELTVPGANRRTVYGLIDRQGLPGMLATFDFASPDTHSPQRYTTTVPQQALFLMNSPLMAELARAFAGRADLTSLPAGADRVAAMIRVAWGRAATEREIKLSLEYIAKEPSDAPADGSLSGWEAFAQTLLLANEFSYVD